MTPSDDTNTRADEGTRGAAGSTGADGLDIDAMDVAALERVVHGANGYPRYVLGTRMRGAGYDGAYTYDDWQRARHRLALMDVPADWELAEPDPFAESAVEPASVGQEPDVEPVDDDRSQATDDTGSTESTESGAGEDRVHKRMEWRLRPMELVAQLMGHPDEILLTVTLAGPVTPRYGVPEHEAPDSSLYGAHGDDRDSVPGGDPGDGSQRDDMSVDSLWGALTGQTDVAAMEGGTPGIGHRSSGVVRREMVPRDSARLLHDALAVVAPPLAWFLDCLGGITVGAAIVDGLLATSRMRPIRAHMSADLPATRMTVAMTGSCTLDAGSLRFCHEPDTELDTGVDDGRIEFELRAPSGAMARFGFSGTARGATLADTESRIGEAIESALAATADFWERSWSRLVAEGRPCQLVACGGHRLMPPEWRARLIKHLWSRVCDDAEQRAIVRVLESSAESGDLARVLDQISGQRAASELLWIMDHDNHLALQTLLERAGIECRGT